MHSTLISTPLLCYALYQGTNYRDNLVFGFADYSAALKFVSEDVAFLKCNFNAKPRFHTKCLIAATESDVLILINWLQSISTFCLDLCLLLNFRDTLSSSQREGDSYDP